MSMSLNRRCFLTRMVAPAAGSLLVPGVASAQWFGEEETNNGLEGFPSFSIADEHLDSEGNYVPEDAVSFLCTFSLANHAHALRRMEDQLEWGRDGMPICPTGGSSYGSYLTGDRREALEALVKEAGVRQDRIITKEMPGTKNAAAILCRERDGEIKQLVIWDPNFLSELDRRAGTEWASVAILAHELAHHLNNDTGQNPGKIPPHERREQELYADRYAGQKLREFGAPRDEAVAVFAELGSGGETHPPARLRVEAAGEGWDSASAPSNDPTPPPSGTPTDTPSNTPTLPPSSTGNSGFQGNWATGCVTNYGYCLWTPGMTPALVGQSCYCPSAFGPIPGIAQ